MEEDEIWLSEEEDEDQKYAQASTDPRFFGLGLTYQGEEGGERIVCDSVEPHSIRATLGLT